MFRHFWCLITHVPFFSARLHVFRLKTAQPWTCASSTTPPAEQRACAGALAAAARLHRLHHEVSELFDWIIVALASVVFYDACKTHIYPVYFWVSFDDHEAITTLFGGEWPLTPEGTARAEVFCVYHDSMELLGAGRPSPLKASFGEARKTHATISLFLGCVAFLCQLICLFVCFCVSWFMSPGETAAAARGLGCAGAGLLRSRRAASASLLQVTCRGTRKTHAINSPCPSVFFLAFSSSADLLWSTLRLSQLASEVVGGCC